MPGSFGDANETNCHTPKATDGEPAVSGAAWALVAGVSFGIFQAVNRRANQLVDAYRTTFALLVVAVVGLGAVAVATEDLSLLGSAPIASFVGFAMAGIIHFFLGWTFLAVSQQRIGAANTGALIAATPLIGSLLAAIVLGEPLSPLTLLAIALVTGGVVLIARRMGGTGERLVYPWFALAAALTWGTSPLFIRWGLEGLPSPIIGVTVGLLAAASLYALVLAVGAAPTSSDMPREALSWILIGGVLVAGAIAAQWTALDLTEVSTVVTLQQMATPVVVLVAPFIVGTDAEKWTWRLISGMVAVLAGSTLMIWAN